MAEHAGKVPAVMLAVGAAFDFLAGTKPQAPRWMMRSGLEWLFRLVTEPRRLARRYFRNNPRFASSFSANWLWGGPEVDNLGRVGRRLPFLESKA